MTSSVNKTVTIPMQPLENETSSSSESDFSTPLQIIQQQSEPEEAPRPLDKNRLLQGKPEDLPINPNHLHWFLNHAIFKEYGRHAKREIRNRIELAILHGYSKAATISKGDAQLLGIQTSPIVPQDSRYHRSVRNLLLSRVHLAYEEKMGITFYEFVLLDSPLIREVFQREYPQGDLDLEVDSTRKFEALIDTLLDRAKHGQFPDKDSRILIDFTDYLHANAQNISDANAIAKNFEGIVFQKLEEFAKANPDSDHAEIGDKLLSRMQLIAYTSYADEHVLLMPKFLQGSILETDQPYAKFMTQKVNSRHGNFYGDIREMQARTGFVLGPDKAKKAWLKLASLDEIMDTLGLPSAQLATQKTGIPKVCKSWKAFLQQPVIGKFRALQNEEAPYLKVLPEATYRILKGLSREGVDKILKEKGLDDLLQISYFRIFNAMQEAILHKNDVLAFNNQIELIHQEVQNILAIVQPYDSKEFAACVSNKMTHGGNPVISPSLTPLVHAKPSAMHCLASIIAGVEAEKGSNRLNVALAQRCYYHETDNSLTFAKTHQLSVLSPEHLSGDNVEQGISNPPVDLFVCEFHHNIMHDTQTYRKEPVLQQVKEMVAKKLVADKFTVVIDTTIDLENSDDIREFMADPQIKKLIAKGKLNVVFIRSAQKYDMLGMDNYYGGITVTVNKGKRFKNFNRRMDLKEDQLDGLSYQGLTHLQKYADSSLDNYRKGVMDNTRKLYAMLPEAAVFKEGSTNPMQISAIEDERMFFLDIKFPHYPLTMDAFQALFVQYAQEHLLPITGRPSFSFINSSLTYLNSGGGSKLRLNLGLEGKEVLEQYAAFFAQVQQALLLSKKDLKKGDPDALLAARLQKLKLK